MAHSFHIFVCLVSLLIGLHLEVPALLHVYVRSVCGCYNYHIEAFFMSLLLARVRYYCICLLHLPCNLFAKCEVAINERLAQP